MIFLQASDLPSMGFNCKFSALKLTPLTIRQMLEYEEMPTATFFARFQRDINLLKYDIQEDILNDINLYDIETIIFVKKLISFSSEKPPSIKLKLSCPSCSTQGMYSVDVDRFQCEEIHPEELDKIRYVEIGGNRFTPRLPKVKDALFAVKNLTIAHKDIDPMLFYLLCILGFSEDEPGKVERAVMNATNEDILLLRNIYYKYHSSSKIVPFVCSHCRKEVEIPVALDISSPFQILADSARDFSDKIIHV